MLRVLVLLALALPALSQARPEVELRGVGSPGMRGAPTFMMRGSPVLGRPFGLRVENARPNSVGALLFGSIGAAQPLSVFAATGFVGTPFFTVPFVTDPFGSVPALLRVPQIGPGLVGVTVFAQALVFDPTATGAVAFSRGVRVDVGTDVRRKLFYDGLPLHPTTFNFSLGNSADFDGNGRPDLVAGGSSMIGIALVGGDMTLSEASLPANGRAWSTVPADVDHDGKLDLLVAVETVQPPHELWLYPGQGDGTFGVPLQIDTSLVPHLAGVDVGDVNGDGDIDLIVPDFVTSPPRFLVYAGTGNGTFSFSGQLVGSSFAGYARRALVRDVTGDGVNDLLLAWQYQVALFPGLGGGNFGPAQSLPGSVDSFRAGTYGFALGDLDGDAQPDLVLGNSVLRNQGGGSFAQAATLESSNVVRDATLADFDGDGDLDLGRTIAVDGSFRTRLYRNDGAFRFTALPGVDDVSEGLLFADFDADGRLDLVTDAEVRRGLGLGNFAHTLDDPATVVMPLPMDTAVADLNRDERLDAVIVAGAASSAPQLVVLHRDRAGLFEVERHLIDAGPTRLSLVDVNGDRFLDAIIPSRFTAGVLVALGTIDGRFQAPTRFLAGPGARDVATADFDRNGTVDLALPCRDADTVAVLLGFGDGTFAQPISYPVGSKPNAIDIVDLDGNGRLDLAVTCDGSDSVHFLSGVAIGFIDAGSLSTGEHPVDLVSGDWNADGRTDLGIAASVGGTVELVLGDGQGGWTPSDVVAVSGVPRRVDTADFDGDGRLDLVVSDSRGLYLYPGNGNGTFQPASSTSAPANGFGIGDWNQDLLPDLTAGGVSIRNRLFD